MQQPLKHKVSISLDEDIIIKIRILDGRSMSQYINLLLKKHIEDYLLKDLHKDN